MNANARADCGVREVTSAFQQYDDGRFETSHDVFRETDKAWRGFWRKRGMDHPPIVSRSIVGAFELPAHVTYSSTQYREAA